MINLRKTGRGLLRADFIDRYDEQCSIQESSIAYTNPCIWLGTDDNRMYLTQDMVRELIPHLQGFVEEGDLWRLYDGKVDNNKGTSSQ